MHTFYSKVSTPSGKQVKLAIPTNVLAAANITDGDDSPFPMEAVNEEISYLRYHLAKHKLYTKVIETRATDHCTIKYIVLERDNFQDRMAAKHQAKRFCVTSDFIYMI